jgi:hypothetical protein
VKINENVTVLPETLFVCKIFLEDNPEMQQKILQEVHNTPIGGHPRISNT